MNSKTALTGILIALGLWNLFEAAAYFLTMWRSLVEQGVSGAYLAVFSFITITPLLGFTVAACFAGVLFVEKSVPSALGVGVVSYFVKSLPTLLWGLAAGVIWAMFD